MPIDASIISQGIKPLDPIDPMAVQARVFALRNMQQQSQESALKLGEQQRAVAMRGALSQAITNTPMANEGGVSVYDIPAITKNLPPEFQSNADEIVKHLSGVNEAFRQEQAAKLAVVQRGATSLLAGGADPTLTMHFIDTLDKNGTVPKETLDQYRQFIQANPDKTATVLQQFTQPQKPEIVPQGGIAIDPITKQTVATGTPKPPTPASLALAAAGGDPVAAMDRLKPKPETSMQAKDVLLDGKPALVSFDPKKSTYSANGVDVTSRVKPMPPASLQVTPGALSDVKESVAGMKDGTLPPMLPGRATKEYLATMAEAHRQGYDLQGAVTDWNATQKHIATMNNAQQTRLNQSINALPDMLDKVDALAAQWKGGSFPILNKANLALAKGGAYGQEVASVANQLDAQIADVTADLGNVYMGGNSPTDHALGLAAKSLSGDWSQKVLTDMTKLARSNVQIRQNSIRNTGVAGASPNNPYAPPAAAPAPSSAPAEGAQQAIPGIAGGVAEYRGGKWVRVK